MDVSIGEMTSTVRAGGGDAGSLHQVVAAVLEAVRLDEEHRERVHAERWIPCCAACAEEAEEGR
ncbi:MAG TPA: hypothetical protein VHG28_14530 [Longimicrobiaceae bacterium]|nr:hypothetical protein [Longimicrobiaceae bacterium]